MYACCFFHPLLFPHLNIEISMIWKFDRKIGLKKSKKTTFFHRFACMRINFFLTTEIQSTILHYKRSVLVLPVRDTKLQARFIYGYTFPIVRNGFSSPSKYIYVYGIIRVHNMYIEYCLEVALDVYTYNQKCVNWKKERVIFFPSQGTNIQTLDKYYLGFRLINVNSLLFFLSHSPRFQLGQMKIHFVFFI